MRRKFWIVLLVLFVKFNGFSQEKFIQHVVTKGETISKIAEQYNVKSTAIYELNPDAKKGIKFKEVLLIPVASTSSKSTKKNSNLVASTIVDAKQEQHVILAKETLYGIAKQYGVKVTDLYAINPSLENKALKVGDIINVPLIEKKEEVLANLPKKELVKTEVKPVVKAEVKQEIKTEVPQIITEKKEVLAVEQPSANGNLIKEVLPKETLYGIAKQYGISVADIEKANPILAVQSLRIGQSIVIPAQKVAVNLEEKVLESNKELVGINSIVAGADKKATENDKDLNAEVEITHEVLPKETKYGIAKAFGISVKELETQNPKIANKLLVGEKLMIRTAKSNVKSAAKFDFTANDDFAGDEGVNYSMKSYQGTDLIEQLICTASENIGVRYRSGGVTKDGFDCSGLMFSTFGSYDIQLPRSSIEQSQIGTKINAEEAKKGDLIFFKTNGRSRINHVGMVVEVAADGEIKFIHASTSSGVIISSTKEEYYSKRVTQINRVLDERIY
ncbi:peptidoglycan endopeptidase [Flavobacterium flavipallidum]|uniref:LysM peptidoglycan-binding domain-containing protein n=1 Tax=Flavobacterium flavipallidum TaxID=3139140 RepID=A0ABU9HNN6_9FLAO